MVAHDSKSDLPLVVDNLRKWPNEICERLQRACDERVIGSISLTLLWEHKNGLSARVSPVG